MNYRDQFIDTADGFCVRQIAAQVGTADEVRSLYALLSDAEPRVAYRAAWVLTHLDQERLLPLDDKQRQIAAAALRCSHSGLRRLLLAVLWRLPLPEEPDPEFLDWCLTGMLSPAEPHGVRMFYMKFAYEMCRTNPDLLHELRETLDLLEPSLLPPSLGSVRRNILRALAKGKSLHKPQADE